MFARWWLLASRKACADTSVCLEKRKSNFMPAGKSILFVCHDRSGSNLMRGMLNQHPDIFIVPPLPVFEVLYPLLDSYGDLKLDANWEELLADIVELANANHHPLPGPIALAQLKNSVAGASRTLGSAVQSLYQLITASMQRSVCGVKFGPSRRLIEPFFRTTQFTHLILQWRDPRDVALSTWKAGVNPAPPEDFVEKWLKWHRLIRTLAAAFPGQVLEQRYEDVLREPEQTMSNIWQFLGVAPTSDYMNFYRDGMVVETAKTSYMWSNLSRPLMRDNKEKFYDEFGPIVTRRLERRLGAGLEEFGYRRSRLLSYRLSSLLSRPRPRVRTENDRSFQKQQKAVIEALTRKRNERLARLAARNSAEERAEA